MILKQGKEYDEATGVEERSEPVDKPSSKRTVLIVVVVALLAVALLSVVVYSSLGLEGEEEPLDDMVIEGSDEYWEQFEVPFSYSDEEKESLRAWGYTGTEIEQHEAEQTPASDLIEQSKQAQEEALSTLNNPASPEYQALLNQTWIGQQSISLPSYVDGIEANITYDTVVLNADYEKIPAHGHNLFLKVYIADGSYVFMECPMARYMELADSGNIVIQYDTSTLDGVEIISNVVEVAVN